MGISPCVVRANLGMAFLRARKSRLRLWFRHFSLFSLFQRACSLACGVLRFSFASFVLSSTGGGLILWIRRKFCAQLALLSTMPTNSVLVWIRTLVLMLTLFLNAFTITFSSICPTCLPSQSCPPPSDLR